MASITVTVKGLDNILQNKLKTIINNSDIIINQIAENTVKVIRFHIQSSIERSGSTGNLALAFYALPIVGGWGVGDINYLNKTVPYWHWINYGIAQSGRRIPPGTDDNPAILGHFDSQNRGRFQKGHPKNPIFPLKPIAPHNFIQRTVFQIPSIVSETVNRRII